MIFAAVDQPLGTYTRADIAFPGQVEVRINGDEVKANYKGLKNKPGSTRPADITEYVRKLPNYKNTVAVTYALTQKVSDPSRNRAKNGSFYYFYLVRFELHINVKAEVHRDHQSGQEAFC
jgi:hypothetical protein